MKLVTSFPALTAEHKNRIVDMFLDDIANFFENRPFNNLVDLTAGY